MNTWKDVRGAGLSALIAGVAIVGVYLAVQWAWQTSQTDTRDP
jgi:hypothetical protein